MSSSATLPMMGIFLIFEAPQERWEILFKIPTYIIVVLKQTNEDIHENSFLLL